MKKKLIKISVLGFGLALVLISSCTKNTTLTIKPTPVVVTKTVSFSKDLEPLFTANCALGGCHISGGQTPDLEAASAFNSLTNGGFINTKEPTSSIVYEHLAGTLAPQMPLGKTPNPGNIEGLVLAWIQQGAKNN